MTAKYQKGEVIRDVHVVIDLIMLRIPLFMNQKCQNFGFLQNLQLHTIIVYARGGHFARAVPNEKDQAA